MSAAFILSNHARTRMRQRNIRLLWIKKALQSPDFVEHDADDPEVLHAYKRIHEADDNVLCVVYNEIVRPKCVVTAFFQTRRSHRR